MSLAEERPPGAPRPSPHPRVALVLGAGGAVGRAYHVAVLAALEELTGWDARSAELVVGTSAGSVVGAVLRAGITACEYAAWTEGEPASPAVRRLLDPAAAQVVASRPPAPRHWRPAAPALLLRSVMRPWSVRLGTIGAAALPEGAMPARRFETLRSAFGASWPGRALWICAVRLDDGERVVFGRDPVPPADVTDAVAASCAIPGWFAPVRIGGARYVDGGAHSVTNLDVVGGLDLDLVVALAPMSGAGFQATLDGALRLAAHRRLGREREQIRAAGVEVVALEPEREDLEVMGTLADAMDATRRAAVSRHVRAASVERLRGSRLATLLRSAVTPATNAP